MFEQFIGTKSVERKLAFDVAGLERYLRSHIADLKGPLQIEQFKGGQSNPPYRITATDGRRFVVRRKPPGKLLPSAHAVDREYTVVRALHSIGFPVARPYVLPQGSPNAWSTTRRHPIMRVKQASGRGRWRNSVGNRVKKILRRTA